uniref:ACYPI004357 protein n=1 Tax=Acyrthosiphon pisum TaxID=7029 RepID=C4WSK3_ACYPI|nr:ACYPI004357 [Acyrthosiphon pisum]
MSDVSKETLKKEIAALLKTADLTKTSAKKIRQELEKKLDTDLDDRKKEIDTLVMEAIKKAKATKKNGKGDSDDENDDDDDDDAENDEEDEEEEEEVKPAKKAAAPKRKKADSSDESAGSDDDDGDKNDGDYSPKKGTPSKQECPSGQTGDVRRRMIVTVMKTGKEPKKERKKLGPNER